MVLKTITKQEEEEKTLEFLLDKAVHGVKHLGEIDFQFLPTDNEDDKGPLSRFYAFTKQNYIPVIFHDENGGWHFFSCIFQDKVFMVEYSDGEEEEK